MRFATRVVHAGQERPRASEQRSASGGEAAATPHVARPSDRNSTLARVEVAIAALEGGEHAVVFGPGPAAGNAVLQAWLSAGDEIVVPLDLHAGLRRLLHHVYVRRGVTVNAVDLGDLAAVDAAITPRTRVLWIDSPAGPRLRVRDLGALIGLARSCGVQVVVDNTLATPVHQQPLGLGADLVIHTAPNYLAGETDVCVGAVVARSAEVLGPVRRLREELGGEPGAFECGAVLRGIQTLDLRLKRQAENAAAIARALVGRGGVRCVHYPGLANHPDHAIATRQMTGYGGVLTVELDADGATVREYSATRRWFRNSAAVGGVQSLILHPASDGGAAGAPGERGQCLRDAALLRLAPGIEDPADLIDDLVAGLAAVCGRTSVAPPNSHDLFAGAPAAV